MELNRLNPAIPLWLEGHFDLLASKTPALDFGASWHRMVQTKRDWGMTIYAPHVARLESVCDLVTAKDTPFTAHTELVGQQKLVYRKLTANPRDYMRIELCQLMQRAMRLQYKAELAHKEYPSPEAEFSLNLATFSLHVALLDNSSACLAQKTLLANPQDFWEKELGQFTESIVRPLSALGAKDAG